MSEQMTYQIFEQLPMDGSELIDYIFTSLYPKHGFAIRKEQIQLSKQIYEQIQKRKIQLCEAEVGLGKTYAYLVAAVVDGIYKMHEKELREKQRSFGVLPQIPSIVISTSSIELQHALLHQYITELSQILVAASLLPAPLRAVIRKGKEHFLCKLRLLSYEKSLESKDEEGLCQQRQILNGLKEKPWIVDLDFIDDLTELTVQRINIPDFCGKECRYYESCAYVEYREKARHEYVDIQICNHNYYFASELRKEHEKESLLKDYRLVIFDEAHKIEEAAKQIQKVEFAGSFFWKFQGMVRQSLYGRERKNAALIRVAEELTKESNRLFWLFRRTRTDVAFDVLDGRERSSIGLMLRDLSRFEELGIDLIGKNVTIRRMWKQGKEMLHALLEEGRWYEYEDEREMCLISYPKDVSDFLSRLWLDYSPKVLVSGTLSTHGDFAYIRRRYGMDKLLPVRMEQTYHPSVFCYQEHARLYISERVPDRNRGLETYLEAVTEEIVKLIEASNGHAVVLFTSYRLLAEVHQRLRGQITYPMFWITRNDKTVIGEYRNSKNGVLLATGSFWEGIDCPGDVLSLLILPLLPFPVPQKDWEIKRDGYETLRDYIKKEALPSMLMKLKQGAGRLIRTEKDTGVLAILDHRASLDGRYRKEVLSTLAQYPLTESIEEVAAFFREVKTEAYFFLH